MVVIGLIRILGSYNNSSAQLPLGCYFFLDKKVTKKSSQQKCLFRTWPYAHKSQNHRLEYFCRVTLTRGELVCKNFLCLFPAHIPSVLTFFAEAVLLTGSFNVLALEIKPFLHCADD